MSDRDTLAQTLKESGNRHRGLHYNLAYWRDVADDLIAAGVRPPARVVADGGEIEAIAVEWMRYIGYTAEQITEAEGHSCADTCERVGDAWDCTDQDGDSLHPAADELAAAVAMANVTMETIEARGWRPPAREITDPTELDKLPVGVIGAIGEGVAIQRERYGWRVINEYEGLYHDAGQVIADYGPLIVLHNPIKEIG